MKKLDRVTKTVLVIALIGLIIMLISLGRDAFRSYQHYHTASAASSISSSVSSSVSSSAVSK